MRWLQVLQLLALLVFLSDAVEITTAPAVIRCNPPARGETTRPVTNQTMSTGSFFEYQCNVGYECIGCNMTATCLNTGNWSIPPPNCSIRNCGTPANGTNTKPIPGNIVTTYRHNYTYECADGYEPNSTSAVMTTSCDEQGHWTLKNPPYCTVKDCGRLEDGTNTQPVPSNIPTIYNSSYTYQCNIGFESSAKLTAFCDKSGKWMFKTPPVCKAISCGPPPEGIKTESFVDGYNQEYLDYYKYKCKPGYTTDDEVIAQCLASKRWSILPPTCHAKKCETPPNGENTKAVPNSIATTYGSSYTYECEDGYEAPSAEMETVCNHQGQWTLKPLPVCTAKNCGMPVDGTDTKPVPSDIRTTYRNSYNYECKEGYERASKSAEMMTSCDQQGRWTLNSPPICKKVDCGPPPIGVNTESTSDGYNTN